MAFFPTAPGHRIQPFVQPRGGNSLPPSPPPEMCLWSSRWFWGREQWQQLHRSWSQGRKGKQNRDQIVTMGGGQIYPTKAANHTLKSDSLPSSTLGQACDAIKDLLHSRCLLGSCGLPRPSLYSSLCSVPPQHNLAPHSCLGKTWSGVTVAPANPHLHQEKHHSRMSTHPSCRCQQKSTLKVKEST